MNSWHFAWLETRLDNLSTISMLVPSPQSYHVTQAMWYPVPTPCGGILCSNACVMVGLSSTDGTNHCHHFFGRMPFLMFILLSLLSLPRWQNPVESMGTYNAATTEYTFILLFFTVIKIRVSSLIIIANTYIPLTMCQVLLLTTTLQGAGTVVTSFFKRGKQSTERDEIFPRSPGSAMTGPWCQPDIAEPVLLTTTLYIVLYKKVEHTEALD